MGAILNISETQSIKALAIIMVMMSHFRKVYMMPDSIQNLLNPCGYLGVALFLMLSGYGCAVSRSRNDICTFLKRAVRVIVPLASATIITIIVMALTKNAPPSSLYVIMQCLGVNHMVCSAAWYITLQYVCWLSFIIMGIHFSEMKMLIWGGGMSLAVLAISIWADVDGLYLDLWGLNAFSFAAGVIMSRYQLGKRTMLVSILLFMILFVTCYFLMGNPSELILRNPLKSLVALSFVIMVFSIIAIKPIFEFPHWIIFIGKNAYHIYLAHAFFAFCFGHYVMGASFPIALVVFILVTVLGSTLLMIIDSGFKRLRWTK